MNSSVKLWLNRVGWLLLIWLASILSLAVVAYILRLFMQLVGLK